MRARLRKPIALIGFMGAGKSSVAAELSQRLQCAFIDLDEVIEAASGLTVAQIFEHHGEEIFRNFETELLKAALAEPEPAVIACGGGIVLDERNISSLKSDAFVIYLEVSVSEVIDRIDDFSTRPLIQGVDGPEEIADLLMSREELYESVADLVVDTVGLDVSEVCDEIMMAFEAGDYELFHS